MHEANDRSQPALPFRPPLTPPCLPTTAGASDLRPRGRGGPPPDPLGDTHLAAHLAKGQRRAADTIWRRNPREQGLIGLTDAIGWFGRQGWSVSLPLIDSQPYDLVVDDGQRLQRVQVKTTTYRSPHGVFVVSLATRGGNQSFHTSRPFDRAGCDLLYVLTDDGERYLLPTSTVRSRATLNLGKRYDEHRLRS